MAAQLGQEESEGVLVGNANVYCVEELTSAAESSNHIKTTDFASGGDMIPLVVLHPSVLAMVCEPDDGLVNVNDSVTAVQDVDKVCSRELSLELGSSIVLE